MREASVIDKCELGNRDPVGIVAWPTIVQQVVGLRVRASAHPRGLDARNKDSRDGDGE